jgi:hypothetical protein
MPLLDALEPFLDLLDPLPRGDEVAADADQVCLGLGDGRLRVLLVLLERFDQLLRLLDGLAQRSLTLLGRGDLVLEAGGIGGRRHHRHHEHDGEHQHERAKPRHGGSSCSRVFARHVRKYSH